MSLISGSDKSEATRVSNQGSFTAMGKEKSKRLVHEAGLGLLDIVGAA